MEYYAFRLTRGTDLRKGIEDYCALNNITAGAIVTCAGCVYQTSLRLADGITVKQFDGDREIVSLTGTISADGVHLHMSVADGNGNVIGGHLSYGSLVNTTAEIVIVSLNDKYSFTREYDEATGYDELVINRLK